MRSIINSSVVSLDGVVITWTRGTSTASAAYVTGASAARAWGWTGDPPFVVKSATATVGAQFSMEGSG